LICSRNVAMMDFNPAEAGRGMPPGAPFSLVYAPGRSFTAEDAEFAEKISGTGKVRGTALLSPGTNLFGKSYVGGVTRVHTCNSLGRLWFGTDIGYWSFGADWDGASVFF